MIGRTNLFEMDILPTGLPIACKPYPIPPKYQKFIMEKYDYCKVQIASQKA